MIIYIEGEVCFKQPRGRYHDFSAYANIRSGNYTGTVVVDSEDTDVYVQAEFVSQHLRGNLLIKRKNKLINCRTMHREEVANIIIELTVISGIHQVFMTMEKVCSGESD